MLAADRKLAYAIKQARLDLEDNGYTVSVGVSGYPWSLVAVREGTTEPVICVQVKRTTSEKGAKLLKAKYQKPYLPSGFQPYQHELWIWIDRKGWYGR